MTVCLIAAYVAVILLAGVDQLIKLWAVANLQGQPDRSFLPLGGLDWMHLHYVENDGAAFSMLSGSRGFLVVFATAMIAFCLLVMQKLARRHRWLLFTMPLIAGGGIGNLIDRLFRGGAVVDYLDLQIFRFAVFNFADCCVTVGVVLLMICLLFVEKEEPKAKTISNRPNAERLPDAPPAEMLPDAETVVNAKESPDA